MIFPYSLPELDLSAPFDRYRAVVLPEWIDLYGHMNMAVYVTVFDQGTEALCALLGVGPLYTEHELGMLFVLETHLTYAREVRLGAPLRVTSQILDHDAKRLRMTRNNIGGAIRHDAHARDARLIRRVTTGWRGGESIHGPPLPAARHASASSHLTQRR